MTPFGRWRGHARAAEGNDAVGAAASFDAVVTAHFPEIYGYLARRLGAQAAEDVAAETFAVAIAQSDRYDASRGTERAWLYGIATNLLRRHRRDEARWLAVRAKYPHEAPDWEDEAVSRVDTVGDHALLAAALARIDPAQRDALFLTAVAGLTFEEAGLALSLPVGTVKSRVARGRARLRGLLESEHPHLRSRDHRVAGCHNVELKGVDHAD